MKLPIPKTRIKVVTQSDGTVEYYPQYKSGWFFWHNYSHIFHGVRVFESLEEAQKYVDDDVAGTIAWNAELDSTAQRKKALKTRLKNAQTINYVSK